MSLGGERKEIVVVRLELKMHAGSEKNQGLKEFSAV